MTEELPEELKQFEKEHNLTGGKWTTYAGIEAILKGNEFIENVLANMEEGEKIPVNGMDNTYAMKREGRLCIMLPPVCVPNPDCKIEVKIKDNELKIIDDMPCIPIRDMGEKDD